ncbi:MAG: hypothetical protein PVH77_05955 [Phycisphaerales bacterium]
MDIILPGERLPLIIVLFEAPRPEGLETFDLLEEPLGRDEETTLFRVFTALEDRRVLWGDGRLTVCFLEGLDLCDAFFLLFFFAAKTGSTNNIRAKITVIKAILTYLIFFNGAIIHLLSKPYVKRSFLRLHSLYIKGNNSKRSNKDFCPQANLRIVKIIIIVTIIHVQWSSNMLYRNLVIVNFITGLSSNAGLSGRI